MPMPFRDKTGQVFGYWTVLGFAGRDGRNQTVWSCKCICGTERTVLVGSLMGGASKSCGCQQYKITAKKNTKHGMAGTRTYKSWHSMIQRTQGKGGHQSYVDRNITINEDWLLFENFFRDMGERPPNKTLDRIDNDKGYSKENCRWATLKEQSNNTRRTTYAIVDGEKIPFVIACEKFNVGISCARHRRSKGFTDEQIFKTPVTYHLASK